MSTISRRVLHLEGRQQCWWEQDWAGACCSGVQPRQSTARSQACQRAKPSACHSSPRPRVHHLASRSRGRELLSSCNAIPLTTVRQQQPHAAVGHEERWLCHLAEAGCFHACAALGPEGKKSCPGSANLILRIRQLFRMFPPVPPPERLRAKKRLKKWPRWSSSMRCHRLIALSWCAACKRHSLLALLRRCTALLSLPLPSVLHSRVLHAACSTQHAMQLSLPPHSPTHDTRWETSSTRMWSVSSASHWRPR